ncbi:MAG: hypothetical protein ACRC1T_09310 [Clostridium chrysemydis]|uniref:hypothetical protein n=1 Tax=Clostridium chrysemydis TaxID=2665504 RepID=UPI003F3646E3
MENKDIDTKIDLILKKQDILEQKLNYILQGMGVNDARANTSIFIQGLFLADLLDSWGNLNGNNNTAGKRR